MKHQQRQHLCTVLFLAYMTVAVVRSMALPNTAATKANKVILHWFRHGDLRLHDNPALVFSSQESSSSSCFVLPVFCYDSNIFGTTARTPTGSLKCGPRRAQFVRESVIDLRNSLRQRLGSELLVMHGEPATALSTLLEKFKETQVDIVMQEEVLKEERDTVRAMKRLLQQHGRGKLHTIWGSTMYERMDLPYANDLSDMPDVFTPFRNKVEKKSKIRNPLSSPTKLDFPANDTAEYRSITEMIAFSPTLHDLGYTVEEMSEELKADARGVMQFRGGETAALQRVKEYIWDKDLLKDYFDTRNGMIGADYSTKLSPWLAHGCVSPRFVAAECKRYEETRVANKSTYWVVFELLWRDFCKFFADKHGDTVFFPGGTVGSDKTWPHYEKNFEAWKNGKTGYPLVDANMREIVATGFMSNRGRQNVASFLALDCNNDWRAGGDWFETHLLDYDVYSNWIVSTHLPRKVSAVNPNHPFSRGRTGALRQG